VLQRSKANKAMLRNAAKEGDIVFFFFFLLCSRSSTKKVTTAVVAFFCLVWSCSVAQFHKEGDDSCVAFFFLF
jgi:hypothetical protein